MWLLLLFFILKLKHSGYRHKRGSFPPFVLIYKQKVKRIKKTCQEFFWTFPKWYAFDFSLFNFYENFVSPTTWEQCDCSLVLANSILGSMPNPQNVTCKHLWSVCFLTFVLPMQICWTGELGSRRSGGLGSRLRPEAARRPALVIAKGMMGNGSNETLWSPINQPGFRSSGWMR